MIKCLVTAIGSMSADCVISSLRSANVGVVGCDIYPGEWHSTTSKCDAFYQAPLVSEELLYLNFIISLCEKESINVIFPLTDIEVDFYNIHRDLFNSKDIKICICSSETIKYARDKYKLYTLFKDDHEVPSINTWIKREAVNFPCIAKPRNGRSSEGVMRLDSIKHIEDRVDLDNYIFQEFIHGDIYTVDYVRSHIDNKAVCISRVELLRTKNGAGTTVRVMHDPSLDILVRKIGDKLNILGCINMEFIKSNGQYYLIDINPRFSAGVAYSHLAGYNMVLNHLKAFMSQPIDDQITYDDHIYTKKYVEEIIK